MAYGLSVLLFFIVLLAGQFIGVLLHELGHIGTAWLSGWRPLIIKVGAGRVWWSFTVRDLEFRFAAWPFSGLAQAYADSPSYYRTKRFFFSIAGPLVTTGLLLMIWRLSSLPQIAAVEGVIPALAWFALLQASMLLGSIFPHMAKIDGLVFPNDSLQAWQSLTMKKSEIEAQILGHAVWAATVFLNRGQTERACKLVESAAIGQPKTTLMNARVLWLHLLMRFGKKEEARAVKSALLADSSSVNATPVEILDSLACLPLYYDQQDMPEEGLGDIEQAITVAPELITLQGTKASLLIELNRIDEGLQLIDFVEEKTHSDHDRAIVSYYRALAWSKRNDFKKAHALLQDAFKKHPVCVVKERITRAICEPPLQNASPTK